jgi:hypothetical protein
MTEDRYTRVWTEVGRHSGGDAVTVAHVCAATATAVSVDGAGVTVRMSPTLSEVMHATDGIATALEEFQLAFGEGPCMDCFDDGSPAQATDLRSREYAARWPAFTPAALDSGARAVFAIPLQIGTIRLGAMDLYRTRPGPLSRNELADALTFADVVSTLLLDGAAGAFQDPDEAPRWYGPTGNDAVIHQATGMVLVQLGVDAETAFARLRAHAYANARRLGDVARDVVDRRLRFRPDPPISDFQEPSGGAT